MSRRLLFPSMWLAAVTVLAATNVSFAVSASSTAVDPYENSKIHSSTEQSSSSSYQADEIDSDIITIMETPDPTLGLGPHCTTHTNCTSCTSALCHWCGKTNTCHTKGDPFGCLIGSSCSSPSPTPPTKKCADFTDCQSCANSSWECHWCPQNNGSCHARGSWSGCATGQSCFAIDRCQRLEPERVDTGGLFSKASFEGVGPVFTIVLAVVMGLVLCCATCCFAGATFVKGAVDDLVGGGGHQSEDGYIGDIDMMEEDGQCLIENDEAQLETPLLLENGSVGETDGEAIAQANQTTRRSDPEVSVTQLTPMSLSAATHNRRTKPRKKSSMRRMYGMCQLIYLLTIILSIILFILGMSYAPRQPQYNVCTNQLGWKSIIEGMATLKVSASFDLLISIYNPNKVEVDLKNGGGQFHYDGEYIGSFEIPNGRIAEEAISDIIVKVTFTPDKWQALSLTAEYYRGTLRLLMGGHAHVSVPALSDYAFEAKFDDVIINPTDPTLADTQLCACPGWKNPVHHEDEWGT